MHDKRDFDAHAATWDGNPSRVKLAREISTAMTSSIEIRKDMDALDFGCGTGLVTLALLPLARTVTGIDSSRGMLEALDRKIAAAGLRNIKTAFYDADSGEPVPGRYHVAVSSMTFHHVRDTEALLRRLHEALHPGGTLCVADL
ncbi:MAG TPA: class I SAM-dependent methyltransferase, partial [Spirochaetota bacterium]|nr:class I SAM-dependent methyltransferase [Spirochaetota bacterium]